MGDLVKKSGKNYMLTEEGKLALKIMKLNDNIISGTQQVDQIDKDDIGKIGITRIGVIICLCAEEISCVLDIEELKRYVAGLKNVVSVRIVDRLCDIREVKGIKDWIDQFFINLPKDLEDAFNISCGGKESQLVEELAYGDIIRASSANSGANLSRYARACADSSAGRMPSVRARV